MNSQSLVVPQFEFPGHPWLADYAPRLRQSLLNHREGGNGLLIRPQVTPGAEFAGELTAETDKFAVDVRRQEFF